jgi:hypothetical protein
MSIPQFTAQASLYRTMGHYRSSVSECDDTISSESIIPAYIPGPETRGDCTACVEKCITGYYGCMATSAFTCAVACGVTTIFYGFCFAGCLGSATAICLMGEAGCIGLCDMTCCPKQCNDFHNPLGFGDGCCDKNEQCVDRYDPNSRQGCCPSDQVVCGGKCCAKGASCCGDTCCAAGYFCREGMFCEREFIGTFPNTRPPTPTPPVNNCLFGGTPCGNKCCPPDLQCCYDVKGQPFCATSCVH